MLRINDDDGTCTEYELIDGKLYGRYRNWKGRVVYEASIPLEEAKAVIARGEVLNIRDERGMTFGGVWGEYLFYNKFLNKVADSHLWQQDAVILASFIEPENEHGRFRALLDNGDS